MTGQLGLIELDEEVLGFVMNKVWGGYLPECPSESETFLIQKNLSANPGFSWVNKHQTFGMLLDAQGPSRLVAFADAVEALIENGEEEVRVYFTAHSKLQTRQAFPRKTSGRAVSLSIRPGLAEAVAPSEIRPSFRGLPPNGWFSELILLT